MPHHHLPVFRFGSFMVRIAECELGPLSDGCVPPSCDFYSVCKPPHRTVARVRFDPRSDPAEFRRLLEQVQRLELQIEVMVIGDPDRPGAATEALGRALG